MKQINILFFGLLSMIFIMSCTKSEFVIHSELSQEVGEVRVSNSLEMIYDTLTQVDGGSLVVNLPEGATILKIGIEDKQEYVYAEPGDDINISQAEDGEIVIDGSNMNAQNLITEVSGMLAEANGKNGLPKLGKNEPQEFNEEVEKKYADIINHIQNADIDQTDLKEWLSKRVEASKVLDKVNYPSYYEYYEKVRPEISDNYYDFVSDFDFNNKKMLAFDEAKSAGEAIISHEYDFNEMESIADYYAAIYNGVEKYATDPMVKEMFQYKFLVDKINYSGGIDGMGEEIKTFIENAQTPHRKEGIETLAGNWAHLQKGMEAPDFIAYTPEGEEVKLSDLKGKNVYIDVWATWCGPCIREIPSLKSLEKEYHDENIEFVSVSIDRLADKEKWKKFIIDRELKGMQIFAPNDWRSEIATNYNIKGIPRFIMIDEEGNIVSADAPRPSNDKGVNKMFAEVLD